MIKNFTDYLGADGVNYVKDTVVAITGGGSGFGRLTAYEVLKLVGKVVISDINAAGMEETVAEGNKIAEGNIIGVAGNVAKLEDVEAMVAAGVEAFGKIDTFVSNAGIMPAAPMSEHKIAYKAWDTCIDVNIKGTLNGICATHDLFMEQGYGHFITISSILGNHPVAGGSVYQATKIAVRYLGSTLRTESSGKIKVSNVNPSAVPGTGLFSTVVVPGPSGLGGQFIPINAARNQEIARCRAAGEYTELLDQDSPEYANPSPEELVWALMFTINQPRGINIGDITLRSTGESFIL